MPQKIFYLDHSTDFSGGQKSLLALLSRLDRSLFKPVAIIDNKAAVLEYELKKINVGCIKINYLNIKLIGTFLFPLVAFQLLFLIKKEKCNLLHCNTFKVGFICSVLSFIIQTPIIFRSRLGVVVNSHGYIDKIIYRCADLILANSYYVKKTYFERFKEDNKIKVVYNPLFLDYTLNQSSISRLREKYFVNTSLFYFGVIGRIEPFKRQHEIIEAAHHLSKDRRDFKILFLGNPSADDGIQYQKYLLELIDKYELKSFFEFTGFIAEINEATTLLDCVVLCTEGEPLSRGIFETQFLKVPVIASESGGNLELIDHEKTGLLYKLKDPGDLAKKMHQVMASTELQTIIRSNGHAFVKETFNPEKTIRMEEKAYVEVLSKNHGVRE